ncbi:hypothetical protein SARC_14582, partial [Sphaeroforma arctica JP610]
TPSRQRRHSTACADDPDGTEAVGAMRATDQLTRRTQRRRMGLLYERHGQQDK